MKKIEREELETALYAGARAHDACFGYDTCPKYSERDKEILKLLRGAVVEMDDAESASFLAKINEFV